MYQICILVFDHAPPRDEKDQCQIDGQCVSLELRNMLGLYCGMWDMLGGHCLKCTPINWHPFSLSEGRGTAPQRLLQRLFSHLDQGLSRNHLCA